jgi:hypothetical protein
LDRGVTRLKDGTQEQSVSGRSRILAGGVLIDVVHDDVRRERHQHADALLQGRVRRVVGAVNALNVYHEQVLSRRQ